MTDSLTVILSDLLDKILPDKFQPRDIKSRLPEKILPDGSHVPETIHDASLTRLLGSYVMSGFINKTSRIDNKKRGHPKKYDKDRLEGRLSFYQTSDYFAALEQVIRKPMARRLIFASLNEGGIIDELAFYLKLDRLYLGKTLDIDSLRTISDASNTKFDEDLCRRVQKTLRQLDDSKIQKIAKIDAVYSLRDNREDDEIVAVLIALGGMNFTA